MTPKFKNHHIRLQSEAGHIPSLSDDMTISTIEDQSCEQLLTSLSINGGKPLHKQIQRLLMNQIRRHPNIVH
jgi:hypothetical protein